MPKRADPLTPSAVTNAKPAAKPYRMPDRQYMAVNSTMSAASAIQL